MVLPGFLAEHQEGLPAGHGQGTGRLDGDQQFPVQLADNTGGVAGQGAAQVSLQYEDNCCLHAHQTCKVLDYYLTPSNNEEGEVPEYYFAPSTDAGGE